MVGMRRVGPRWHTELELLQREVSELFERLNHFEDRGAGSPWRPPLDIFECSGSLVVVVEVPGISPDSLRVTMSGDTLAIAGERRSARKSGATSFVCMERPHGRFVREVRIEVPIDLRKAEARLSRGLLTIWLPRLQDRRGRANSIPVVREEES